MCACAVWLYCKPDLSLSLSLPPSPGVYPKIIGFLIMGKMKRSNLGGPSHACSDKSYIHHWLKLLCLKVESLCLMLKASSSICIGYIPVFFMVNSLLWTIPNWPFSSSLPGRGASLSAWSVVVQYFNSKPFSFSAASTMSRCPCGRPRRFEHQVLTVQIRIYPLVI